MEQKLDKKKYLQRVIIVSWIALIICFVIKLFGGNLFEIVCTNETFIAICDYADTHLWANYLISALYCFISLYFFTLAIMQKTKYKAWQLIILILTVLGGTALKIWNSTYGLYFDIWQFIIMPAIFLSKQFKKYLNIIIANVSLIVFQLISMYVKDIEIGTILGDSVLVGTIYSIDILLMVILYFAYVNIISKDNNHKDININTDKEVQQNG